MSKERWWFAAPVCYVKDEFIRVTVVLVYLQLGLRCMLPVPHHGIFELLLEPVRPLMTTSVLHKAGSRDYTVQFPTPLHKTLPLV